MKPQMVYRIPIICHKAAARSKAKVAMGSVYRHGEELEFNPALGSNRKRQNGGTVGTLPDGTQGIVSRSYTHDYRITEAGRKALESSL